MFNYLFYIQNTELTFIQLRNIFRVFNPDFRLSKFPRYLNYKVIVSPISGNSKVFPAALKSSWAFWLSILIKSKVL